MRQNPDHLWWSFALDQLLRGEGAPPEPRSRLCVEPRDLDYAGYLMLDTLLAAQAPSSAVPDERAFIITHQLIELIFKLMIFDLGVIARAFTALLQPEAAGALDDALHDARFWRPALTASSRVLLSSRALLPLAVQYLRPEPEEHFSREAFFSFRDNLGTASGFQSAQFRLIQRALGKSGVLAIRLFPRAHDARPHDDADAELVTLVDRAILTRGAALASPERDGVLSAVARLDDLAHQVLGAYAGLAAAPAPGPIAYISSDDVERAVGAMRRLVAHGRAPRAGPASPPDLLDTFQHDLEQVVRRENARRSLLHDAYQGAHYLRTSAPSSALALVLGRLALADSALHGEQSTSFLSTHFAIARDLLKRTRAEAGDGAGTVQGTGGGGISYLGFIRKYLVPLFPALIAFRGAAYAA